MVKSMGRKKDDPAFKASRITFGASAPQTQILQENIPALNSLLTEFRRTLYLVVNLSFYEVFEWKFM